MAITVLSYGDSILNPVLKLLVPVMFIIGTYLFYQARCKYGGNLGKIANLLMWGGLTGFIATAFRYGGDYIVQWKWGESTLFLIFAIISLIVAYLVYTKFREIAEAFGIIGGDD